MRFTGDAYPIFGISLSAPSLRRSHRPGEVCCVSTLGPQEVPPDLVAFVSPLLGGLTLNGVQARGGRLGLSTLALDSEALETERAWTLWRLTSLLRLSVS